MTKVTIGLPVFNGIDYISQAIESILSQTFADFELYISDNASDDGTAEICRDFARRDRRIRYLHQPHNVGAAENYNLLFALGTGPYFKWAAHDDILHPRFLDVAVGILECHPHVVVASPAAGETTQAGLPRRVPRANLVPGSVGSDGTGSQDEVAEAPARSADAVRSRMSSFQRGVREGRAAAPQTEEP